MTTEEQFQYSEIQQINGTEDNDTSIPDNQSTSDTSSAPVGRRSRFFRTRRKQRLNDEPANQANDQTDETSEPATPSEDSGKTHRMKRFNPIDFDIFRTTC
jgi:hypothetical protein